MGGSYEKINYAIRPAKSVERKMMCEVFRRLGEFGHLDSYRYIGFGSPYFSDFNLVHRSLGIRNMISIEKDVENKQRFEFNRPFNCIQLEFGTSNEVLPRLMWDMRSIVWLDYDGRLNRPVLADIETVCIKAVPGSFLAISVNAVPDKPNSNRVEILKKHLGEEKVPRDISDDDLAKWGTARTFRRIINNCIDETLRNRNAGRDAGNKIHYQQIFNFHYSDGANMLTVGGIFYDEGQESHLAKCMFGRLPFVRENDKPYVIRVPNLTYREIRYLDRELPATDLLELSELSLPNEDLLNYQELYRYFPTFVESEI